MKHPKPGAFGDLTPAVLVLTATALLAGCGGAGGDTVNDVAADSSAPSGQSGSSGQETHLQPNPAPGVPVAATPPPTVGQPPANAPEPAPAPAPDRESEPEPASDTNSDPAPKPAPIAPPPLNPAPPQTHYPEQGDAIIGVMGATADWPVMPISASITPDGRLLTFGRDDGQSPEMLYDVWDWQSGLGNESHLTLPNRVGTDLFCSNTILLSNGQTMLVGGDVREGAGANTIGWQKNIGNADVNIFDSATNKLSKRTTMNEPRWYASVTKLPSGEIFIHGGAIDVDADIGASRTEMASEDASNFRILNGFTVDDLPWYYPRNFVDRYGDITGWSHSRSYRFDLRGDGKRYDLGNAPQVELNNGSVAVMYRPGKILLGGGGKPTTILADINGPFPSYQSIPAMDSQRLWATATVLPDGKVLVSNGGTSDTSILNAPLGTPAQHVSIYDPDTNTWLRGPSSAHARLYHSSAVLLPDATILLGGGGFPGPVTNLNAEIYFPPYLFNKDGSRAPRPVVTTAPTVLAPGDSFSFKTNDNRAISKVVMVKTGSVTHSFDVDQRYLPLDFARNGDALTASLPSYAADTTPGFYHLFVLNEEGVPSISRIIRIIPFTGALPPRPAAGPLTRSIGGTEGSGRELSCALNERLVGVHGRGYDRVQRLGPICARVDQTTGAWLGEPIERALAGDMYVDANNPEWGNFSVSCARNQAVAGYHGASSADGRFIGRLSLSCQTLGAHGQVAGTPAMTNPIGMTPPDVAQTCPASQSATGIHGLANVNAFYNFALRCGA